MKNKEAHSNIPATRQETLQFKSSAQFYKTTSAKVALKFISKHALE